MNKQTYTLPSLSVSPSNTPITILSLSNKPPPPPPPSSPNKFQHPLYKRNNQTAQATILTDHARRRWLILGAGSSNRGSSGWFISSIRQRFRPKARQAATISTTTSTTNTSTTSAAIEKAARAISTQKTSFGLGGVLGVLGDEFGVVSTTAATADEGPAFFLVVFAIRRAGDGLIVDAGGAGVGVVGVGCVFAGLGFD